MGLFSGLGYIHGGRGVIFGMFIGLHIWGGSYSGGGRINKILRHIVNLKLFAHAPVILTFIEDHGNFFLTTFSLMISKSCCKVNLSTIRIPPVALVF